MLLALGPVHLLQAEEAPVHRQTGAVAHVTYPQGGLVGVRAHQVEVKVDPGRLVSRRSTHSGKVTALNRSYQPRSARRCGLRLAADPGQAGQPGGRRAHDGVRAPFVAGHDSWLDHLKAIEET